MFLPDSVHLSLQSFGYRPCGKYTYRHSDSSEMVDHYLYLSFYGRPKEFLSINFGIRHMPAEIFAVRCLKVLGGALFQDLDEPAGSRCTMQFSLGRISGWQPRWSLTVSQYAEDALRRSVDQALAGRQFQAVQRISTTSDLFRLLSSNNEPCPWHLVSGALRAAQVTFLGRSCGMSMEDIRSLLLTYHDEMSSSLGKRMSGAEFLNGVVEQIGVQ